MPKYDSSFDVRNREVHDGGDSRIQRRDCCTRGAKMLVLATVVVVRRPLG